MNNPLIQQTIPEVHQELERTVQSSINVLIQGENGVGKDYLAGLIYRRRNWGGKLVICDCERTVRDQTSIVEQLTSPSFFQILKRSNYKDTLLIRRIDLLQVHLLAQLSDFLEKLGKRGVFSRNTLLNLGIIGSMEQMNESELPNHILLNKFLNSLFCFKIEIPPLREKIEMIPQFVDRFLSVLNRELKRNVTEIASDALEVFLRYHWPNNLSELRAEIERDITLTRDYDTIKTSVLSDKLLKFAHKNGLCHKGV